MMSIAYDRKLYRHWVELDGVNTRERMLRERSEIEPTIGDDGRVIAGLWLSDYDGVLHRDPSKMDLDHIIALGHVHRIGGADMSAEQREAIANDPDNLLLVTAGSNRQKSDHSGSLWLIPNLAFLEEFIDAQEFVRVKYDLGYDPCEERAIEIFAWIAERTSKGIRLSRADRYALDFAEMWESGSLQNMYTAWQSCKIQIQEK